MPSPAQAHAMRVAAAQVHTRAAAEGAQHADATQYELMLLKLAEDRRRLKQVESQQRKIDVKRQLLPEYVPWVDGALQGQGAQDDVLMSVMVWRIDVGDWRGALDIAAYALRYGLSLPDQYKRNLPCLLAEEFADNALLQANVPAPILAEVDALLLEHDMPDQVRAKLAKALAYAWIAQAGDDTVGTSLGYKMGALEQLRRALRLHDKVGVKKDIERLERELNRDTKNTAEPASPAGTA